MHFITISVDEAGQRTDNFLRTYLKGIPKSMIYRIVRKGQVRVNKKRITPKYKLQHYDKIRIPPVWQLNKKHSSVSIGLDKVAALNKAILYEDDSLLIINKLAGTAAHGGSSLSFGVIEGLRTLRADTPFLELVHRLDRDTSGVLLVAKKRSVLRALHEQLRTNKMQKYYLALVGGKWPSHIKKVSVPLLKNILTSGIRRVLVNSGGKPSETYFQIEERFQLATLVRVRPITGRTHQIRVHAQYTGHPIVYDNRYGDITFDQHLKKCGLNRMFLHAAALCFNHPDSGETLRIEAPLDMVLRQCLLYLRAYYPYNTSK